MKKVIAFTIALGIIALCYCAASAATNDYIWSQKPASGPLVSRNLTPTVGRIIGFPTSINSPETIIIGSGLTLTGSTLTASGGAFSTLTDVTLTSLASGDFLKWSGTAWINRTAANVRTDLGLGTMATQASSAVAITGGTLSGITSFAIANTGTVNATSAASLRLPNSAIGASSALSLVSVANGGSGYELHFGDKDGVDRTLMTLDYAQTPTNKTISGATNTITDLNASNLSSGTVADARLSANVSLLGSAIALASEVTGTLPVANGGTGITALGTGVTTWLGTPTIANLNAAVSDADLAILGANSFTGRQTISVSPAATESAVRVTGAILTGGSGTTNLPHMLVEITGATAATTWSANGTGLGINVGTGSRCMDVRQNGAIRFQVDSDGQLNVAGVIYNTQDYFIAGSGYGGIATRSAGVYAWSSDATAYGTQDLKLARAAAGILDLLGNATGAGVQMTEKPAPAAPAANKGILFLEDNGAGKTRLMIQFSTGAAQQIAIEP